MSRSKEFQMIGNHLRETNNQCKQPFRLSIFSQKSIKAMSRSKEFQMIGNHYARPLFNANNLFVFRRSYWVIPHVSKNTLNIYARKYIDD